MRVHGLQSVGSQVNRSSGFTRPHVGQNANQHPRQRRQEMDAWPLRVLILPDANPWPIAASWKQRSLFQTLWEWPLTKVEIPFSSTVAISLTINSFCCWKLWASLGLHFKWVLPESEKCDTKRELWTWAAEILPWSMRCVRNYPTEKKLATGKCPVRRSPSPSTDGLERRGLLDSWSSES